MADAAVSCQAPPTRPHGGPGDPQGEVLRLARSVDRLGALVRLAVEDDDASRLGGGAARGLGRALGPGGGGRRRGAWGARGAWRGSRASRWRTLPTTPAGAGRSR